SNSASAGGDAFASGSVFLRGLLWAAIAIVVLWLATASDCHWLKTFSWPLYLFQLGLLVVTLGIGTGVGGTSRWVTIFGLQFQFSEIDKILLIVVLANYLATRNGRLNSLWSILGACVLVGPPMFLVLLQPDLGTSL